jgi:hypothetical protein
VATLLVDIVDCRLAGAAIIDLFLLIQLVWSSTYDLVGVSICTCTPSIELATICGGLQPVVADEFRCGTAREERIAVIKSDRNVTYRSRRLLKGQVERRQCQLLDYVWFAGRMDALSPAACPDYLRWSKRSAHAGLLQPQEPNNLLRTSLYFCRAIDLQYVLHKNVGRKFCDGINSFKMLRLRRLSKVSSVTAMTEIFRPFFTHI